MRLINIQAAIDAIRHDPMGGLNYESILSGMPVKGRWIPCSERMPEAGQIVLVSNKYGQVWIFKRIESGWSVPDEGWFTDEEEPDRVKAWMPLPKPYEERREDNADAKGKG